MLDIRWIRENPRPFADALKKRGSSEDEAWSIVNAIVAKDQARRMHLNELQDAQANQNAASKEIGRAFAQGDKALAEKLKTEVAELKSFIQQGEAKERKLDKALNDALAVIPNVPLDEVPVGPDETANVELRKVGKPRKFTFEPKQHFELGEALDQMDFETAAKISGSRFTLLKGGLARLERALGQFMLDLHTTEHGYTEVQPPLLVHDDAMFGTGQLPKFDRDLFFSTERNEIDRADKLLDRIAFEYLNSVILDKYPNFNRYLTKKFKLKKSEAEKYANSLNEYFNRIAHNIVDDKWFLYTKGIYQGSEEYKPKRLWLIPTAEVSLTNIVREKIIGESVLPTRITALTPCFRLEAGSAGKDTRGYLRQHQFYKVELVSITSQETSLDEHERMTKCAEEVLKRLDLPFRTVVLSTGDMGFGARKTYDIEVWLPGQGAYREISSCSVCGDFQARRMNARYRAEGDKQTRFVHTLNGSGVAVGRALIAVMENCQNEDGSITVPDVLRPYMGGMERVGP